MVGKITFKVVKGAMSRRPLGGATINAPARLPVLKPIKKTEKPAGFWGRLFGRKTTSQPQASAKLQLLTKRELPPNIRLRPKAVGQVSSAPNTSASQRLNTRAQRMRENAFEVARDLGAYYKGMHPTEAWALALSKGHVNDEKLNTHMRQYAEAEAFEAGGALARKRSDGEMELTEDGEEWVRIKHDDYVGRVAKRVKELEGES